MYYNLICILYALLCGQNFILVKSGCYTRVVWIFQLVVPHLVLRTVSAVRRFHRAFEAFDDSDRDLARFVELRIFPRCDQLLVQWSHDIEPWLT
jgi:hypothetical protein